MNFNIKKSSQFELFPGTTGITPEGPKPAYRLKDLTLSLENTIVISIILVMMLVLSFSFGVKKGKYLASGIEERNNTKIESSANSLNPQEIKPAVMAPLKSGQPIDNVQGGQIPPQIAQQRNGKLGVRSQPAYTVVKTNPLPSISIADQNAAKKAVAQVKGSASSTTKSGGYTVQVASYKSLTRAQREADFLKKRGLDTLVMTKGNFSIVCVGKFGQFNEAKKYSERILKEQYNDCLVRRL